MVGWGGVNDATDGWEEWEDDMTLGPPLLGDSNELSVSDHRENVPDGHSQRVREEIIRLTLSFRETLGLSCIFSNNDVAQYCL